MSLSAAEMRSARHARNESTTMVSKPWRSAAGFSKTAGAEANKELSAPSFSISSMNLAHAFFASFSSSDPSARTMKPPSSMALRPFRFFWWATIPAAFSFTLASAVLASCFAAFTASSFSAKVPLCSATARSAASMSACMAATLAKAASSSAFLPSAAACASARRALSIDADSSKTSWMWPITAVCKACRSSDGEANACGTPAASISSTRFGTEAGIKDSVARMSHTDWIFSCKSSFAFRAIFAGLGVEASAAPELRLLGAMASGGRKRRGWLRSRSGRRGAPDR
mmetsp:Transcript_7462/g.21219  ORF Transcript_7462/g.21219 Transcript_7462/m.21219 type:complete len:285 (+) Transcript_7462:435-1289(+)